MLAILTEKRCDLSDVLESCGVGTAILTQKQALHTDLSGFDAFCVLGGGKLLDARLRVKLEAESAKGKRLFLEAVNSWGDIYSAEPVDTTRSRLIWLEPEDNADFSGFETGDLLDDESNLVMRPWAFPESAVPLLVYREHIVAHDHTRMSREEILDGCIPGLWLCDDHTMMTSFLLADFNRARFVPRSRWQSLIRGIAHWLTGAQPAVFPDAVVRFGVEADLNDPAVFELCRQDAIRRGMAWLDRFLVDEGHGGIREGLRHNIHPDGTQDLLTAVRNDCTGEACGAYAYYARVYGDDRAGAIASRLEEYSFSTMLIRGGRFDGMMRWTEQAWGVCYGDDVARAILPQLYLCRFAGKADRSEDLCRALDFLVRTTSRDGLRRSRTDCINFPDEASLLALAEEEHAKPSAHHNAWYAAALLMGWQCFGKADWLDTARRGLASLMAAYPDTAIEHSQTQEAARLILPLALLYEITGDPADRETLYRVAQDLQRHRHPCGGYREWDEHYAAHYSRTSSSECSLLTENGDPVADLLYTCNWLPIGFAEAFRVTQDPWFRELWQDIVRFCLRTQCASERPLNDGSWCRAFDMDRMEAYACPHDAGWAACASESGWTNAEILMGLMLPEFTAK